MTEVASEDNFLGILIDYFELDAESVSMDSRMIDDLGFDSIMFVEIVFLLEDQAGETLDEELLLSLVTLRDVYHYYSTFKARQVQR